jgi:small subunit ribosomal protein S20
MANHKSAAKKARRDAEARLRNRSNRSELKTAVKKFLAVVAEGNKTEAAKQLPLVQGLVDKGARKGVMHKNAADRTKSRLAVKVNALA